MLKIYKFGRHLNMSVEFFVSLRIENNNNLNLETMINMSNQKDSERPPPEGPEPLMQGCNGLVDGLETSFQGCNEKKKQVGKSIPCNEIAT